MIYGCQRRGDVDVQGGILIRKVAPRPRWGSETAADEVDCARVSTEDSVEGTRPDLPVRHQIVRETPDFECEREQTRILIGGDTEEACSRVRGTAGQGLVFLERICKSRHKMSALDANHPVTTCHSPMAMRMKVVPVSITPAVDDRMVVSPYEIDWSIPQKVDAGEVFVSGT